MSIYTELKAKHQKEVSNFPLFFAFGVNQFNEMLDKMDIKSMEEAKEKILSMGAGCYILKKDVPAYDAMVERQEKERKQARKDKGFQYYYDAFLYELGNHEYCVTADLTDTLDALGMTLKEISKDEVKKSALLKAMEEYIKGVEADDADSNN